MATATRYELVRLLHISADIVFIAGLLAGALALAALSFQAGADLVKERRAIDALRRFNRIVTGPALVIAWVCGTWLALQAGWLASHWLQLKLVLVLALSAVHGAPAAGLRRACAPAPVVPARVWRVTPALVLVATAAAVWLALMKPF
jgi:protoporphyrinogen IX oxidase